MGIIKLHHCNYGEVAVRLQDIVQITRDHRQAASPLSPITRVYFAGGENGWAFKDPPEKIVLHMEAAGIALLRAVGARDQHGLTTWLVRDHITLALAYGEETTDLRIHYQGGRLVSVHEPYASFVSRWEACFAA